MRKMIIFLMLVAVVKGVVDLSNVGFRRLVKISNNEVQFQQVLNDANDQVIVVWREPVYRRPSQIALDTASQKLLFWQQVDPIAYKAQQIVKYQRRVNRWQRIVNKFNDPNGE